MAWSVLLRRANAQKQLYRNFSSHADPKQLEAALKMWQNLAYFGVPVALGLGALNVYLTWEEPKAPEFIPYDHLRIRTKRFPWGDGNHSFFHNPHLNALPTGYEHEEH